MSIKLQVNRVTNKDLNEFPGSFLEHELNPHDEENPAIPDDSSRILFRAKSNESIDVRNYCSQTFYPFLLSNRRLFRVGNAKMRFASDNFLSVYALSWPLQSASALRLAPERRASFAWDTGRKCYSICVLF